MPALGFSILGHKLFFVNNAELAEIAAELQTVLVGHSFGRIFPLSKLSLAVDFRLNGEYLFISAESGNPRIYLIRRRLRDIEKQSANPTPFILGLRKRFSGAVLNRISKIDDERVLAFEFETESETGNRESLSFVVQLTGRSANLFVIDAIGSIIDRLRETNGDGQDIGTHYAPPKRGEGLQKQDGESVDVGDGASLSQRLDAYYLAKESDDRFHSRAESARKKIRGEIAKKRKLAERLEGDLREHGNADQWKRYGDLLLANSAAAKREGDQIRVTDYYDEQAPEIEISGDRNSSISEIAENYFKRYTKARNAASEIARRMNELNFELARLQNEFDLLEDAILEGDESYFLAEKKPGNVSPNKKKSKNSDFKGARRFRSTDGYEILVGKKAKDNDFLTFRIARSLDLWLHAADYPGSHVVVRHTDRKEIPQATLIEAAELAAFYSDAREQPKAAVNYTQKKFVNKPKGAAPGLVSLASFKTILVRPRISTEQETPRN